MQIDFHHGVTYVVARLAGFDHREADIIAYCAQYVDDATNHGLVRFNNGAFFKHTSSAHKTLDYRNFRALGNNLIWIPFHFLPGNGGLPPSHNPDGDYIHKLICLPNSFVAQTLLKECVERQETVYGLYWLGIAMHVYADTWAHQGFAGVNHPINEAKLIFDGQGKPDSETISRIQQYFNRKKNLATRIASKVMSEAFPIGHGAVLSNPDKPFLKWGYINGLNQRIERNNPKDFLDAAENMCRWMQRYRLRDAKAAVSGLPLADKLLIGKMLQSITDNSKKVRHRHWLTAIKEGKFSFGEAEVNYIAKGKGSWKYEALGTTKEQDVGDEVFSYCPQFLKSHWKLFHDALEAHRVYVIRDLLPYYGICIA